MDMDWSKLTTITTFDDDEDDNSDLFHNKLCLPNCRSLYMNSNDPKELTTVKPTTAVSLLIEGLVQLICKLMEGDNKNVEMSYKVVCEKLNDMILIDDSYARHEFADIRAYYEKQMYTIIRSVCGKKIPIECFTLDNKLYIETFGSRYKTEFEEIRFIAGGGFGKVFQARHKLDSIDYAVKQIKINSSKIKLHHFAEVKTIASLNHPNIVQYKSAWLEPILPKINEKIDFKKSYDSSSLEKCENQSISSKNNSLQIVHCDSKVNSDCSFSISKSATLYIQMSLCKLTLQEWLVARNNSNDYESCSFESLKVVYTIFCQILEGLNYIHSKKIIHHDIKPSNIFLDFDGNGNIVAQLGDFGLACPLQDDHKGYPLGTKLYAAPEQLQGECNSKSDVYSLGIVLIELLLNCQTDMERIKKIENVRKGNFPSEFTKPSIQLLKRLLGHKKNRPTASDVLKLVRKFNLEENISPQGKIQTDESKILNELNCKLNCKLEIKSLKDQIIIKDQQICDLNTELLEKNKEIKELKDKLKKYMS